MMKRIHKCSAATHRQADNCAEPLVAFNAVFLFNNLGELIRARLTRAGYEELGRAKLIEPEMPFGGRKITWSPPSYANGHVFVRNDRESVCASLAKQEERKGTSPRRRAL